MCLEIMKIVRMPVYIIIGICIFCIVGLVLFFHKKEKVSSFHVAVANAYVDDVREMVKNSPFLVSAKGSQGATAMHWICLHGSVNVTELGDSDYYANILDFNANGEYETILKLLIDEGADLNATMMAGITPLHLAASYGSLESVKLLVENGARIDTVDDLGQSATDRAEMNNDIKIRQFIEQYESSVNDDKESNRDTLSDSSELLMPEYLTYQDEFIAFRYPSGAKVEPNHDAGYYNIHIDKAVLLTITNLSPDAFQNLYDSHKSTKIKSPDQLEILSDLEYSSFRGSGFSLKTYRKSGSLIGTKYLLFLSDDSVYMYVTIDSTTSGKDIQLSDFQEMLLSITIKQ